MSTIEHGGKWKMSHYYAEKFLRQTIVSADASSDRLNVSIINDMNQRLRDLKVSLKVQRFDQLSPCHEKVYESLEIQAKWSLMVESMIL